MLGAEEAFEPFLSAETSTASDQFCFNALEISLVAIILGSTIPLQFINRDDFSPTSLSCF